MINTIRPMPEANRRIRNKIAKGLTIHTPCDRKLSTNEQKIINDLMAIRNLYTKRSRPVISAGTSRPIIDKSVGARSHKAPFEPSSFISRPE